MKICEMNDVLHLIALLLLSWSTEVHYIIFIISQLGLWWTLPRLLQNPPGWSPPLSSSKCCQSDPSIAQHVYITPVLKTCQCFPHPLQVECPVKSMTHQSLPFQPGLPSSFLPPPPNATTITTIAIQIATHRLKGGTLFYNFSI